MSQRAYDVTVASLALGVEAKWIDNLLSHHTLPGCSRGRQGLGRRITDQGLLGIWIVRRLFDELGVPLARAAELVRNADNGSAFDMLRTDSGIRIELPLQEMELDLRHRLPDALLAAPRRARGRKPRQRQS